jgi:dihydrofolate reductase
MERRKFVAKLIFSNLMSLDGFCAGPGGDLNELPMGAEFDQHNLDLLRGAGALLFGRVTFDLLRSFWPEVPKEIAPDPLLADISGRLAKARKSVVSNQLTLGPTDPWSDARIVGGAEVNAHVRDLKAATDGDVVAFGSRHLMNTLLGQGLVDELHLLVGNIVLGKGERLFLAPASGRLALVEHRQLPQSDTVLLRYTCNRT